MSNFLLQNVAYRHYDSFFHGIPLTIIVCQGRRWQPSLTPSSL